MTSATRSQRSRSSWPSSIIAVRVRAGELREKFRLADERMTRADDGFLVHRRGHHGVEFVAQAASRGFVQPGDSRARGGGRAFDQIRRAKIQ